MAVLKMIIENDIQVWLALTIGVLYLAGKLEKRKYGIGGGIAVAAGMFLWLWIADAHMILFGNPMIYLAKYMMLYMLTLIVVYATYKCHLIAAVFYATAAYCLQNGAAQIWEIFTDEKIMGNMGNNIVRLFLLVLSFWILTKFLNATSTAESYMEKNTAGKRMILMVSVLILVITVVLQIMCYKDMAEVQEALHHLPRYMDWYLHATSAIISYLVLMLTFSDVRKSEEQKKVEVALSLLEKGKSEYKQEKAVMDAFNVKCHDLRHQIAFLGETGYRSEMEGIRELIDLYDSPNQTGNRALDIVIAEKSRACLGRNISMTCMADGSLLSFMEQSDIYSLFGNILDNAISAAAELKEPEKRIINVRVRRQNSFVMIEEENYYDGEIEFADGLPRTGTGDYVNHGFGVQSMKLVAEKYGGNLYIDAKKGVFRLSVMMVGNEK